VRGNVRIIVRKAFEDGWLKVLRAEVLKIDWFREKKGNINGLRGFPAPTGSGHFFKQEEIEAMGVREGFAFAGVARGVVENLEGRGNSALQNRQLSARHE
jgi:hypothetical protein